MSATLSPFAAELEFASEKPKTLPPSSYIAASKLSSADIITDIIQQEFPYRITSLQSSDLSSSVFIGQDDAAYIGQDEVIITGFGEDLLLSNLKSEGMENKETDEDSIVLAEAERILDKHLAAFKELAK